MNEVMAIGDNFDDEKLIQSAGLGVTMGNTVLEFKELAVAKAIQTFIFE